MSESSRRPVVHPHYPNGRGLQTKRRQGESVRLDLGGGVYVWCTVMRLVRGDGHEEAYLLWEGPPSVKVLRSELVLRDAGLTT